MKAIAAVEAELARTIGLGVVKTLWVQLKRLRLGMLASGDAWVARHVEIRGPKGSGKRTAQHLVKKMGSALSLVRSEFTCKVLPADAAIRVAAVVPTTAATAWSATSRSCSGR